ncbi:MAG: hemolysin family protein [Acidimicrobiales bacterium]|jgi:CBS domain containing-hemolysin-like protein|nr:hemolysin family protein [Acidimicrobiia bacterium]|tara:strand:+ start:9568 stop:10614 length:1047 start_codon:yes stop_codon:yes gene_type:complete
MLFVILVTAIFLILVNSVFVATEISLVASRISRLEELAEGGSRTAKRALEARKDLRKQLSGSQLGITLSSVILGILAEPSVGELIRSLLENLGAPSGASETASWIAAIAIAAMLQMMFGEIVPKNIAIADPERTLLRVMPIQRFFVQIAKPVILLLDKIVAIAVRPLSKKLQVGNDSALGMTELLAVIKASKDDGLIESFEHELLTSALDLGRRPVSSIMINRSQMVTINRKMNLSAIEEVVVSSGHSRLPVVGNTENDLLGFLHVKDFLRLPEQSHSEPVPLEMIRRMLIVPPDLLLDDLLLQMRRSHSHLAGVKTSEGVLLGLVALEDVIEELVGEIEDESDFTKK